VPAAAVIPAPVAYTKIAAVKKLVVGSFGVVRSGLPAKVCTRRAPKNCSVRPSDLNWLGGAALGLLL
jgi:hypothetical protein